MFLTPELKKYHHPMINTFKYFYNVANKHLHILKLWISTYIFLILIIGLHLHLVEQVSDHGIFLENKKNISLSIICEFFCCYCYPELILISSAHLIIRHWFVLISIGWICSDIREVKSVYTQTTLNARTNYEHTDIMSYNKLSCLCYLEELFIQHECYSSR